MMKLLYISFMALALFAFACKKETPAVEAPVAAVQEEEAVATEETEATDEEVPEGDSTEESTTDEE
ncbi:MAG: hypothetical protein FWF51_00230 [Chitinivibrionia bacterium]|jgi:hypothetical protein|nr:hypothetical protein [Chitinivibrionia bacterium]